MAEKTYSLPQDCCTDKSTLQLNQILIVSSGPDKKYSLSYKLSRLLFCHCYKTKKCSLSYCFVSFFIKTSDSLNWSDVIEGTLESTVVKLANISKFISDACYSGRMQSYSFQVVTCIQNLCKP